MAISKNTKRNSRKAAAPVAAVRNLQTAEERTSYMIGCADTARIALSKIGAICSILEEYPNDVSPMKKARQESGFSISKCRQSRPIQVRPAGVWS
jgi:hypothetical protein